MAVVSSYQPALMCLDAAGFWCLMADPEAANLPDVPAAVVTRIDTCRTFRRAALAAASLGLVRRVFLRPADALAWADQQAADHHRRRPAAPAGHHPPPVAP